MSFSFRLVSLTGEANFSEGNMDFLLAGSGSPEVVAGVDCIAQSFEKGLLTLLGRNRLTPTYGTRARDLLGSKLLGNVTVGLLATMVEGLIRFLLAEQQKTIGSVDIPREEQLVGMREVSVTFMEQSRIVVASSIRTRASEAQVTIQTLGVNPNV